MAIAGSPGIAGGPPHVAATLDDLGSLNYGDVLVCPMTTPAWTSSFGIASAVVTELGNPLSHAAIVAREYGIPCVLGLTGAMNLAQDAARVGVDGDRGVVSIRN